MMPFRDAFACVPDLHATLTRVMLRSRRSVPWLLLLTLAAAGCGGEHPAWTDRNQRVIDEHKISGRSRELPRVSVPMVLTDGEPVERAKLPTITIAPGVTGTLGWGRGALVERIEMQADATYPSQTLGEELFVIVVDGSATMTAAGKTLELTRDHAIYLQPGATRSMKAGAKGFRAFEIYSPVRLDHLAMAGQNTSGVSATFPDQGVTPSLQPGVVVDLNDVQLTPLTDPTPGKSYRRSTTSARLLWGKNAQISLVHIDPQSEIALHIHPEDQLTTTVRGTIEQGVMDHTYQESGAHAADGREADARVARQRAL
jgi:gluconolactonase